MKKIVNVEMQYIFYVPVEVPEEVYEDLKEDNCSSRLREDIRDSAMDKVESIFEKNALEFEDTDDTFISLENEDETINVLV